MGSILEEYKKQLNDESLTDEEVMQRFKEDEKSLTKRLMIRSVNMRLWIWISSWTELAVKKALML